MLKRAAGLTLRAKSLPTTHTVSAFIIKMAQPISKSPADYRPLATLTKPSVQECAPVVGFTPKLQTHLSPTLHYKPVAMIETVEELAQHMERVSRDQDIFAMMPQDKVDFIFAQVAKAASQHRLDLAKLAFLDTGRGCIEDKVIKNQFSSDFVYRKYKDMKTAGVIHRDQTKGIVRIAEPVGPIAAITPVTNPTSTTIFKALLAMKTRNCIVFSPHPGASVCSLKTVEILHEAAVRAGAPHHCISIIRGNLPLTKALISNKDIRFILATGGGAMVKAAYQSGKPAIGGGPGNCPALIDETADMDEAVASVVLSKTFDNGMICASENSCVVVESVFDKFKDTMAKRGGYFLNEQETKTLDDFIILPENHKLNGAIVGKTAMEIAKMAGIQVPDGTVILLGQGHKVDYSDAMAYEKLCPILGVFTAPSFNQAVDVCVELLRFGGPGHTATLHTHKRNRDRIEYYATKAPVSRVLVNMPASQGAIGDVYNFDMSPSMTLGTGARGGSMVAENVGPNQLMNIKIVADREEHLLWLKVPKDIYFERGITAEALMKIKPTPKRIFLVTDLVMEELHLVDRLLDIFKHMGATVHVFDRVLPDPTWACIQEGVTDMNSFKPDTVIAFGGGSPMDAAKIMRVAYEHPEATVQDMATRFMDITKRSIAFPNLGAKVKNMVCIPTTSGTGAEVTPFAVVTDVDGIKYPICSYELTPNVAIIDSEFCSGMPKKLTAQVLDETWLMSSYTGLDALVHAIESYVSIMSSEFTRPYSLQSIKLIFDNLETAVYEPTHEVARENMHHASTIAGLAFSNSFLGITHSLAHQLGAHHHIPHGLACALFLPYVIQFNSSKHPTKMAAFPQYYYSKAMDQYAEIADHLRLTELSATLPQKAQALVDHIQQLKHKVGVAKSIKELGVSWKEYQSSLDKMAESAFDDQCTGCNPRYPLISELKQILVDAYEGTRVTITDRDMMPLKSKI